MGPSPSNFSVTNFNSNNWVLQKQNGYCVLVKNKQTGQILQEYDMLPKGDITMQQELEFYEYRKNQDKHIVSVIGVTKGDSAGLCTGKDYYKVYTQRIPFRLTQVDYLTFPQSLMVIRDALIGFDDIKDSYFGSLKVTNEMIGFTPDGIVKVWINQQFKFNTPDRKHIMKGHGSPLLLITQIFAIVQESMADKQFPQDFRFQMNKLDDSLTYQKAIKFIQDYSHKKGIQIPAKLNIVRTSINSKDMNQSVEIAEPYNIHVHPVPISNHIRQINEITIPESSAVNYLKNNFSIQNKSLSKQTIHSPININNTYQNIPQQSNIVQQRRQVRVINQQSKANNKNNNTIFQSPINQNFINRTKHVRNESDVTPFQVADRQFNNNRFDPLQLPNQRQRLGIHQRQIQPIHSTQKVNKSPQFRGLPHKNIHQILYQSTNNSFQNSSNNILQAQRNNKFTTTPISSQTFNNSYSSNNLYKNRLSPQNGKSSTFMEPDTLNDKIDALTANIANMHKELQQSARKNSGFY